MASSYRPGRRRPLAPFRLSKNRIAWVRTAITQLTILRFSDAEMAIAEDRLPLDEGEYGDTIRLMITTTGGATGRPFTLNLTAMTHEEYVVFRDCLELALRLSEPVIIERDRRAAEAYANDDDTHSRSYRQLPQFVIRAGQIGPDDQGILNGLEYALAGPGVDGNSDDGLRADGAGVADEVSEDSRTQDDGPTADKSEGVGEVGSVGTDAGGLQSTDPIEGNAAPAS